MRQYGRIKAGTLAQRGRAFTMIDVLASMAVIMLLIALLLPSLSTIRETARRVVCGSNVRQIGLGLAMYADDYEGFLPPSRFSNPSQTSVHESTLVRALMPAFATSQSVWDGLGMLYHTNYLDAPGVFYCPSHHGDHPYANYASRWSAPGTVVYSNYQFRVGDVQYLDGTDKALVADALRTQSDFNHTIGCNFLRRDLSATWYTDSIGAIVARLPVSESDAQAAARVFEAWQVLDGIDSNGDPR